MIRSDIQRLLQVKDAQPKKQRKGSVGSDGSDQSDLSTQSMPQYSSYRALSGGLFGPFEDPPLRPNSKTSFLNLRGDKGKVTKTMSQIPGSHLKTPSVRSRVSGEPYSRPSSTTPGSIPSQPGLNRENSSSKLPIFRRETSMPQMKCERSIPTLKQEKSDLKGRPPSTNRTVIPATPRGTVAPINPKTTPKTVAQQKVSERNIAAKGTRSAISGISDSFVIGDKVSIIGTEKKGTLLYIGETKFAKGIWAGVVLNDATGKNDGSVAGVRYFSCPPLKGVFIKEEKLERQGESTKKTSSSSLNSSLNKTNTSSLSVDSGMDDEHELAVGEFVAISTAAGMKEGTLRYIGLTGFAKGTWCGVELTEPNGKNDGAVAGTRYFQCETKHGIFAQLHKVRKVSSSSGTGDISSPQHAVKPPVTPNKSTLKNDSTESDDTLKKAIEVAVHSATPVSSVKSDTNELNTKICALQNQLLSKDLQMKQLQQEKDHLVSNAGKSRNYDQILREHQENMLRLQTLVNHNEREKLEFQNEINLKKQKIEDLQFQLEEQMMLVDEKEKAPSERDLDKVIGLQDQLQQKCNEIENMQTKLDMLKQTCEDETFKLNEKNLQLEGKEQEIDKLGELLKVTKENEASISNEVIALKKQVKELRNMQGTISDSQRAIEELRFDYENKLKEGEQKNANLHEETNMLQKKLSKVTEESFTKDERIIDCEEQIKNLREEVNSTVESKRSLTKQIYDLNMELNDKRAQVQQITMATEQSRKEHLDLKAKAEASDSRNKQLIEDKQMLEAEILKVSKNSGDNAQQLIYHNEQLQMKNSGIASLQDKNSVLSAENRKLTQEIADEKDKTQQEKQMYEKEKNNEIKKLCESLNIMEEHFIQLKGENEEMEQNSKIEKLELQKSNSSINDLNSSLSAKDSKLKQLQMEVDVLKGNLANQEQKYARKLNDLESAQSSIKQDVKEIERLNDALTEQQTRNKVIEDRCTQVESQLCDTRNERDLLDRKINCCRLENEELRRENETVSKTCKEILLKAERVDKEHLKRQREFKKLEEVKTQLSKQISTLQEQLASSSSSSKKTEEDLQALEQKMCDGSTATSLLQEQLESTRAELKAISEKHIKIENENSAMTKNQLNLMKEKEQLLEKMSQKQAKEDELINDTTLLRNQLKQAIDRETTIRNTLEADRAKLKESVERAMTGVKTMEDEVNSLRSKIAILEKERALASDGNETKATENETKENEVKFLNSIIVDLQKKNKLQEEKIKILSYGDELASTIDDVNTSMSPLKSGLRMRLFCDICDIFDAHETEDCPLQSNGDDMGSVHHGVRGEERPYCNICETFGHTTENCDDEETF